MDRGMPNAKLAGVMHFGLDDAPLAVWSIQHLPVRLLEWKGPLDHRQSAAPPGAPGTP